MGASTAADAAACESPDGWSIGPEESLLDSVHGFQHRTCSMIDRRGAVLNVRQELRLIQQHEPRYIVVPAAPKQSGQLPGTLHSNFVHRGVHTKSRVEHDTQNTKICPMPVRTRDDVTTLSAGIKFHTVGFTPRVQTVLASGYLAQHLRIRRR